MNGNLKDVGLEREVGSFRGSVLTELESELSIEKVRGDALHTLWIVDDSVG